MKVFLSSSYKSFIKDTDLAEFSITSSVETVESHIFPENTFILEDVPGVGVLIELASGEKCVRCWKVLPEVGTLETFPDLCHRCANVVERIDAEK